jgi:MOSC domain-containing protein YiiM
MDIVLFSVQVGQPRLVPDREPWLTAFYKTPVEGPVHLGRDNLAGDRQADLTVHGGPDKAVCVYSGDHYATWRGELAEPACGPGWFGENFTVAKQAERTVCIGDVYQVGSAVVEVSQPRSPCWKLAKRWGRLDLPKLVVRSGRSGWYLRVLEEGMIAAGQVLSLLRRPHPEWTVERVNHLMYVRGTAASEARGDRLRLAACAALSEGWRTAFLEAAL